MSIDPLRVVPAGSQLETEIDGRVYETSRAKDFLIWSDSYRFDGETEPTLPRPGDLILWHDRVFEALKVGARCYEFEDQSYDELLRVHTKEISG